jgi:hypothetical protein
VAAAMGLAPLHGQLSMPNVSLVQHALHSRTVETAVDPGAGSNHRRSHSHAAAFMVQYGSSNFDAAAVQQQQQMYTGLRQGLSVRPPL